MEVLGHILREYEDYVTCKLPCGNEIDIRKKVFTGTVAYGYAFFMNENGNGFDTVLEQLDTEQSRRANELMKQLDNLIETN